MQKWGLLMLHLQYYTSERKPTLPKPWLMMGNSIPAKPNNEVAGRTRQTDSSKSHFFPEQSIIDFIHCQTMHRCLFRVYIYLRTVGNSKLHLQHKGNVELGRRKLSRACITRQWFWIVFWLSLIESQSWSKKIDSWTRCRCNVSG